MNKYFVYLEKILGVSINKKKFNWSFGKKDKKDFLELFDECEYKVFINVTKSKKITSSELKKGDKFNYFYGLHNENKILYERKLFKFFKLKYLIRIEGKSIFLDVNHSYFHFIKFNFLNLHSINSILFDMMCALMLKHNLLILYGAAVTRNGKSSLIFGAPRSGKSFSTLLLNDKYDYDIIGEDLLAYKEGDIYGFKHTHSFRDYGSAIKIKSNLVSNKSVISDMFLIEKGDFSENTSDDRIKEKIKIIQKILFNHQFSPTNVVFSYFNEWFNLSEVQQNENDMFNNLFSKVELFELKSNSSSDFYDFIKDIHNIDCFK